MSEEIKTTEEKKRKRGRPSKAEIEAAPIPAALIRNNAPIDKAKFERACALGMKRKDIAALFRCSEDKIERWCTKIYKATYSEVAECMLAPEKMKTLEQLEKNIEAGDAKSLFYKLDATGILPNPAYANRKQKTGESESSEHKYMGIPGHLLIAPFLKPLHIIEYQKEKKINEFIYKGGRGGVKSTNWGYDLIHLIETNPTFHGLVLRQYANTLKTSCYQQVKWCISQMGLDDEYEYKLSPLEITKKKTGQIIYFRGCDDEMKVKSIKMPFGYIGVHVFEEFDQFKSIEAVRNVKQSVARGGDITYTFESFNPPKSKNHWANKYVEEIQAFKKESAIVIESSYLDVPPEWLGQQFISEAEYLKKVSPKAYEHEYLGIANGDGGMVFENVVAEEITDKQINEEFEWHMYGMDFGYSIDPNVFVRLAYIPEKMEIYIYDEYISSGKSMDEMTDDLMADHGLEVGDVVTCDNNVDREKAMKARGIMARATIKGPQSVDKSIYWLNRQAKIVIDPVRCPYTYKEFTEYEYDRTPDGIVKGYLDKNNHAIDAVRYATNHLWKRWEEA